jgi:hypothetical protein
MERARMGYRTVFGLLGRGEAARRPGKSRRSHEFPWRKCMTNLRIEDLSQSSGAVPRRDGSKLPINYP